MSAAGDLVGTDIVLAPDSFDDWTALHALLRDAFAWMDGRIDPPSSMHRLDVAALARKAGEEVLLLALDEGRPVGCCFLRPEGSTMYLGKLAVGAGRRGEGLGRRLVRRALDIAAERGAGGVELQVRVELVENRRFFERLGFVEVGRSAHEGFERPTSVTMRAAVRSGTTWVSRSNASSS